MDDVASVVGTERADINMREYDAVDMEIEGERGRNLVNELAATDRLSEALDLAPSMLASRATKMFTEGDGQARMSEERALAMVPTLYLLNLAREAVAELFSHTSACDLVLGGWSSCSSRAPCAPDGNYIFTLAGHSRST